MGTETRVVLLRASALVYLFRVLATTEDAEQRARIESQLMQVIADLAPCAGGVIVLGRNQTDMTTLAREREMEQVAEQVAANGMVASGGILAAPLYVRGNIHGMIALNIEDAGDSLDTVTAIATIASAAIENAREVERLSVENTLLKEQAPTGIVGESAALRRLMDLAERVAPRDTTVLILGESGTGKELIARTVHEKSKRAGQPFVAINCAAITDTLLESEMFGHEKGSFTGADKQKKGKLELAEGGTVFLDEIGELASGLQAKMLRVLQQREFERVGGTRTIALDVRLVAATNRDLAAEVRAGRFREDLFHRLNVVALRTPALRDRREDIPALADHFLHLAAARCGRRVTSISTDAMQALCDYEWPGNVRELENAIERAVVLGDGETVLPEDLPETVVENGAMVSAVAGAGFQASVSDAKRDSILRAWTEAKGDYKVAAQSLGLHPNSLLRLVRKLGIRERLG